MDRRSVWKIENPEHRCEFRIAADRKRREAEALEVRIWTIRQSEFTFGVDDIESPDYIEESFCDKCFLAEEFVETMEDVAEFDSEDEANDAFESLKSRETGLVDLADSETIAWLKKDVRIRREVSFVSVSVWNEHDGCTHRYFCVDC